MYSGLLVIRWRPSGKSRSQQEIKAITPALYEWYVQCSLVWLSVALWSPRWHGSNWKFWTKPFLFVPNAPIITDTNLSFIIIIIIIITIFIPCMTGLPFKQINFHSLIFIHRFFSLCFASSYYFSTYQFSSASTNSMRPFVNPSNLCFLTLLPIIYLPYF